MENTIDFYEILDHAIKDISKRVAKMDFTNASDWEMDANHSSSLVITTHGDYVLTIVFHTSDEVLHGITQNMKHGAEVKEGDIAIYAAEYFNILCGHVISAMNRSAHRDARFNVPQIIEGECPEDKVQGLKQKALYYCCPLGNVKVETFFNV